MNNFEIIYLIFKDKQGNEHLLTKEMQELWKKTFGLESIEDSFTPKIPNELKEALGKDILLQKGSLLKLVSQKRTQFIPHIKEVLESPEVAIKDEKNAFLLVKHLKDDDYFVNVSVDKGGKFLISISNGIKEFNNLKNKLEAGAKVIYQSPNANSNLQTLLQASRYSANEIDNEIIPQDSRESKNPKLERFLKSLDSQEISKNDLER